jgi:hypothetical protein
MIYDILHGIYLATKSLVAGAFCKFSHNALRLPTVLASSVIMH